MDKSEIDPRILEQIKKLEQKYEVMGQDLSSYLDGLLYSDYLTYWNYVHLDTLLSLQNPKTQFKDEMVFIVYHQITELYFKLILWEIDQICFAREITYEKFMLHLKRIINYFEHLTHSFSIMMDGMEKDEFLKFRMSLLPASGFQSAQYRFIEMRSTDFCNLVHLHERDNSSADNAFDEVYKKLYWKQGATELATGKKTLTLRQFEEKYYASFEKIFHKYKECNLLKIFQKNFEGLNNDDELVEKLKEYDELANISWPLVHYKSAARYLHKDPEDIKATGGTNWQKYLPPRFQKVMFFPQLWSEKEKHDWGKSWVKKEFFREA